MHISMNIGIILVFPTLLLYYFTLLLVCAFLLHRITYATNNTLSPVNCVDNLKSQLFKSMQIPIVGICLTIVPMQPDGCKLPVLLTFSYVNEKLTIFPV